MCGFGNQGLRPTEEVSGTAGEQERNDQRTRPTTLVVASSLIPQIFESRAFLLQQSLRVVILDQSAFVQHAHKVEVDDCLQLMRDRDDRVAGKLLANKSLDIDVGLCIDAVQHLSV